MKNLNLLCLLILIAATTVSFKANAQSGKPVLNHIAFYVKDLKVSTTFYRDIVQIDTIPEPFHDGRHTWFAIGDNAHLHLIQGAKAIEFHDKNSHLCFSVPSMEDFIGRLNANHIRFESWTGEQQKETIRVDGIHQIYFKDPDGYWVEINTDYKVKS